MYDIIIVGAGPAGITAGIYAKRAGANVLILYSGQSNLEKTPEIENYYGFVDGIDGKVLYHNGIEQAKKFILDNLEQAIEQASKNVGQKDYKTVLQEKLQKHGSVKIEYDIIKEEGPDHDKTFVAEVKCDGKYLAQGSGKSNLFYGKLCGKMWADTIRKKFYLPSCFFKNLCYNIICWHN